MCFQVTMGFQSIDDLQSILAKEVFSYTVDRKKAAGRSLGTIVEIITYYLLRNWNLSEHIIIENKVPEFANSDIIHNVEFSLHHIKSKQKFVFDPLTLPLTAAKLRKRLPFLANYKPKTVQILTRDYLKRNAALIIKKDSSSIVINICELERSKCSLIICELYNGPFAIFECKRVGVEEGVKKGPQTIEKAKQGAYVARSVSALQKIRLRDGQFHGIIEQESGKFKVGPYFQLLSDIVNSSSNVPSSRGFILTVGVVSNHGNWFTSDNQNKELRVLSQSYDWLLFLTDDGLAKFIDNLILNPKPELYAVREAFLQSYCDKKKKNRFTKVCIDVHADKALQYYFDINKSDIESWFNIISPRNRTLYDLQLDLHQLAAQHKSGGN